MREAQTREAPGAAGGPAAFAGRLRGLRLEAGLTQEALAERAGLGVRTVQALEAGESWPLRTTLLRLAQTLGLTADAEAALAAAGRRPPRPRRRGAPPAPGAVPARRPAHNLPLQLTSFVGRARERAGVRRSLSMSRLVTLTGPGGVGKTRLALRVAADVLPEFPDGVWLAELAALDDPALVPQAVAAAVGVREAPGRPLPATLADALRPRRLLLVLDNAEHLVDACARLADALLRASPGLTILATSREPLGLAAETAWPVPPLAVPDAGHPPPAGMAARYAAVRLFRDRAVAARPAFRVTARNAPAVAQLCARLDGLPLALELAAARVRVLPVEELAARLEDRFRLLTGGSRAAPPRQRTLRATLDWSHDLLSAPERALFRRLSVFAGGWTLAAAEAVCAGADGEGIAPDEVLGLLIGLVDKSLVTADEQPDGSVRYRLLETLRQYARERLAAGGEGEAVRRRHAAYFLGLAEAAGPDLLGGRQSAWLDRLEREHDNLRAALEWLTERGAAEAGLRLADAVGPFWMTRGYLQEPRARLERLLALPGAEGTSLRARVLVGTAGLAWAQGDYAAERRLAAAGLAGYRAAGDAAGAVKALGFLARAALDQGDYAAARDLAGQALAPQRDLPWPAPFLPLAILAHVARDLGEYATARPLYEENLARARAAGDRRRTGHLLESFGWLAGYEGDLPAARARFEESLALRRALGQRHDAAGSLTALGWVAVARGDAAAARAFLAESLPVHREVGNRFGVARALEGYAALAARAQPARALRLAGAAAALRAALGRPMAPAERPTYEGRLEPARRALGPRAADAARAAGRRCRWRKRSPSRRTAARPGCRRRSLPPRCAGAGPFRPAPPRRADGAGGGGAGPAGGPAEQPGDRRGPGAQRAHRGAAPQQRLRQDRRPRPAGRAGLRRAPRPARPRRRGRRGSCVVATHPVPARPPRRARGCVVCADAPGPGAA